MNKYYFRITATGRGQFPIDQLRRYEMFPVTADAALLIECSFNLDMATRKIELGMYANSLSADGDCIERFKSFGWSAATVEIWKDEDGDTSLFWTSAGGYERERQYNDAYGSVS